ncbi:SagB/ThcOx family dehydrogenase [Thermococcus sp.]|uniref:SagB/ThcOx family dehydrogenase n=2 Tax=Thermococcus sp. TaxID=35749 RepID=UPI0026235830|nr:SagB/ThcOx family dehydrogenase [Thermococcus sp.]
MIYRRLAVVALILVVVLPVLLMLKPGFQGEVSQPPVAGKILLPEPRYRGQMSVEEAIAKRRSIREYSSEPLKLWELGQLLWAAQGITSPDGKRAAPSAGPTYPFEVYAVVGNVEGLPPGIYHYVPKGHYLEPVKSGDFRGKLQAAALNQEWVGKAAVDIVLVAFYERTTKVYGDRGIRYVHMEAGHIGENIYLQATALGLGTVAVGAFDDGRVARIIGTTGDPLYIFPVGRRV